MFGFVTGEVTFDDNFYTKYHFVHPKVSVKKDGEKITFSAEKEWELRGAKKDYLAEKKDIQKINDSEIIDQDEDGNPGFTIKLNLKFPQKAEGKVYYVQRLSAIYKSELVEEGDIQGKVKWTDEQHIIGVSDGLTGWLETLRGSTNEPDDENSTFQFVQVDDSMTCEQLLAQKDTLFDI